MLLKQWAEKRMVFFFFSKRGLASDNWETPSLNAEIVKMSYIRFWRCIITSDENKGKKRKKYALLWDV